MWWTCGERAAVALWWTCGGRAVALRWRCGGAAVDVRWTCGERAAVALRWARCGGAVVLGARWQLCSVFMSSDLRVHPSAGIMKGNVVAPSKKIIEGFQGAKRVFRAVAGEPDFHKLDVSVGDSENTTWGDGGRIMYSNGSMSHIAVGVMTDVTPMTIVHAKNAQGVEGLQKVPALDVRVGNDIRFDPKLLQIELGKFQIMVHGKPYAIDDPESTRMLAKVALDSYFQYQYAAFNSMVRDELVNMQANNSAFDVDNVDNIKAAEEQVYNYYLSKTAENLHAQLREHVEKKTLVATYLKLHLHLVDGETICATQNYLDGRRIIVSTVAGDTSCAAVGSGAMMGIYQHKPNKLTEEMKDAGKEWLKPYEKTTTYTAAVKGVETSTEFSRTGFIEAAKAQAEAKEGGEDSGESGKKRKSPEPGDKSGAQEDKPPVAEIHSSGVNGVRFFGVQSYLTLQFKGVADADMAAPPLAKGGTRGGGGARQSEPVPKDTTVRKADKVNVMAMNLVPGTEIEKTPRPKCIIPPWRDMLAGVTCFFVTGAKLRPEMQEGPAADVLDVEFDEDAVRESFRRSVDMLDGLADAVSDGAGFQDLSKSKCFIKEADLTPEQIAVKEQAQMKINQLALRDVLKCSNEEINAAATTPSTPTTSMEVEQSNAIDYEALKAQGLKVGTTGALSNPTIPLSDGSDALGVFEVQAKEHDGKDDDVGCKLKLQASFLDGAGRWTMRYAVRTDLLIRFSVKNRSSNPKSFVPVHVSSNGTHDIEDKINLAFKEDCELPYSLQLGEDETFDTWHLKNVDTDEVLGILEVVHRPSDLDKWDMIGKFGVKATEHFGAEDKMGCRVDLKHSFEKAFNPTLLYEATPGFGVRFVVKNQSARHRVHQDATLEFIEMQPDGNFDIHDSIALAPGDQYELPDALNLIPANKKDTLAWHLRDFDTQKIVCVLQVVHRSS